MFPAIPAPVVEILVKAVATIGEEIVLAIIAALKGGDVSAVEQLTKTGLEEAHQIALIDAALEISQAAKAGA